MNHVSFISAFFLLGISAAAPAMAQTEDRTWVSRTGNDGNDCTETSPCRTFGGAYSKTRAGGTVGCLDAGDFGSLDIRKSITLSCKGQEGAIARGFVVVQGDDLQVVIRGIVFDGGSDALPTANAILITSSGSVAIEDCVVRDSHGANQSPNGSGVLIRPHGGALEVSLKRSTITGTKRPGVNIIPSGGSAKVTIENSSISDNNVGIRADTTDGLGWINLTVVDTILDGNTYQGLVAEGGAGRITVYADRLTISNNGTQGVRAINNTATVRLANSGITGHAVGTEVVNGGVIQSFGNNRIVGNGANGPALPLIGQQ